MEQYLVTGMSCAACQARVEKAVSKVPGVENCAVNLLTNSMGVEGTASNEAIIEAVRAAGYGASLKNQKNAPAGTSAAEDALADRTTPVLKKRLIASGGFLILLMYVSMGHMMWGFPLPAFFEQNPTAVGLLELLLSGVIMVINRHFFVSGFKSLFHGAPNMDTLIALGSGAAFSYSTVILFCMIGKLGAGDHEAACALMNELYFESAGMILTLITVGKMLEARSKGKTTDALKSLMKMAPQTAMILRDGAEVEVSVENVRIGDVFTVRPGESIPVDGIVLEGSSAVNEAALTGESIPVDKMPGSEVSSGTVNTSGFLTCEAVRVGEDTSLAKIIQMVSDAASEKAPIAKLADTISGYFVPVVIGIAVVVTLIWLIVVGKSAGYSLARGISVLVVSCPCALGLATPAAIMVGNGVGARNGILFKTAEALQEAGNTEIIALDKTGTITCGEPNVTDVIPEPGVTEEKLIAYAAAVEGKSEHPLAKAVTGYAQQIRNESAGKQVIPVGRLTETQESDQQNSDLIPGEFRASDAAVRSDCEVLQVTDFEALPGNGLSAIVNGEKVLAGSLVYITKSGGVTDALTKRAQELAEEGKTPLIFKKEDRVLGMIAVADTIREDSAEAISELKKMGIHVVMLTGDNRRTAEAIGRKAGVSEVISEILPDGKEAVIRKLKRYGKTAMVGDGINDAPALTRADIGIAIGAGTDAAIDAADVVLMKSRLRDVPAAIRLSRASYRTILWGLFWALIYNSVLIPIAAGVLVPFHVTMDPMFGALAMSLSSFCVVTNALRLGRIPLFDPHHDKRLKKSVTPDKDGRLLKEYACASAPDGQDVEDGAAAFAAGGAFAEKRNGKKTNRKKEDTTMTKTLKIEGMMCPHCEARVKKALEAVEGVDACNASHETGTASVSMSADVADELLIKAVEDQDYKVLGME